MRSRDGGVEAGRRRDCALTRCERAKDRRQPCDDVGVAADHEAVPALGAPDAAARAGVDVVQPARLERRRPPHIVLEVRVAAVDDDVARRHAVGECVDCLFGRCSGRNHHPDGARWLRAWPRGRRSTRCRQCRCPAARRPRPRCDPRSPACDQPSASRRAMLPPMRPSPISPSCIVRPCRDRVADPGLQTPVGRDPRSGPAVANHVVARGAFSSNSNSSGCAARSSASRARASHSAPGGPATPRT